MNNTQRGTKLVRDICNKLAPLLLAIGKALGHRIECCCQLADLILRIYGHALTKIAAGDPGSGRSQLVKRENELFHQEKAQHYRKSDRRDTAKVTVTQNLFKGFGGK